MTTPLPSPGLATLFRSCGRGKGGLLRSPRVDHGTRWIVRQPTRRSLLPTRKPCLLLGCDFDRINRMGTLTRRRGGAKEREKSPILPLRDLRVSAGELGEEGRVEGGRRAISVFVVSHARPDGSPIQDFECLGDVNPGMARAGMGRAFGAGDGGFTGLYPPEFPPLSIFPCPFRPPPPLVKSWV